MNRSDAPSPPPSGAQSPIQIRLAENREIGSLNDKHADYISEVRFLQAVHRKLKMRLDQWTKAGKPAYIRDSESIINGANGDTKSRYDADAEKIPSLNIELSNTRSRYESALRGRDMTAEDSLLVRLCDVRSQICLAKGRGKVIQEECQRLRKENQKLIEDIASQRQIFDRETQERYSYERRAVPLLRECEELLRKCKMGRLTLTKFQETVAVGGYTFDDIERDRKHFRAGVEASMGDIRRQYEILASTVNSEMEQWYKEQITGIEIKQREDASSYKKKLADLRSELVDVRTKLAHLEERNRLLTSLIGDFEDAREQEKRITDTCLQEDEDNLKRLIERYNELTSGPRDEKYTVATLRAEIMRYRELLEGVGPRSNRDFSNILKSVFDKMDSKLVARRTSSTPPIGSGATPQTTYVSTSQTYIREGGAYEPYGRLTGGGGIDTQAGTTKYHYSSTTFQQVGGGTSSQPIATGVATEAYSSGGSGLHQIEGGTGTTYAPYGSTASFRSGVGATTTHSIGAGAISLSYTAGAHDQIGSGASARSIGGGVGVTPSHIGGGVTTHSYAGSQGGSGGAIPLGQGAHDVSSEGSAWSSRQYSYGERKPATVTTTVDYTMKDERGSTRTGSDHHDYSLQRTAQGNVNIGKVASDGSYVIIENTSMDIDQHIGEWTLRSTSSSLKQVSYTFPRGFVLKPQSTVQVFARGKGVHDPPRSLVCEAETTFSTGDDLDIYLYDDNGQERARLTQRGFFRTDTTF